ncbi:LysR family transcriptional regulator [Paraferrimonas sedimenticola]|uniref:LysR family transcriptional regulator n=1 Tax=Paraferrimonas sedimenticola TaxID=375674 RepID=A0AA37RUP7_9GAMM|nr:LysR family transcriptional regulator [Paraferrimonas sedimenticola]GLP95147.1 LysR family transcriptional regulator [Paraferrimonas sedimenticola]
MNMDQLLAFVVTVEKGSLSQASRQLGKASSTVSYLVTNLEIDIGVELFVRHAKKLEVTPEGETLYPYAKSILQGVDFFQQKSELLAKALPEKMVVAIDSIIEKPGFGERIARFKESFPSLDVSFLSGDTSQVQDWVLQGEADVGIKTNLAYLPKQLAQKPVEQFQNLYVGSPKMTGIEKQMTLRQIRDLTQITYRGFSVLGFDQEQAISNNVFSVGSKQQSLEMLLAGLGWAVMPEFLVQKEIEEGKLTNIVIDGEKGFAWQSVMIYRSEQGLGVVAEKLLEHLK